MNNRRFIQFAGWTGAAAFVLFVGGLVLEGSAGPSPSFKDTAAISGYLHNHATLLICGGLAISAALMLELVMVASGNWSTGELPIGAQRERFSSSSMWWRIHWA